MNIFRDNHPPLLQAKGIGLEAASTPWNLDLHPGERVAILAGEGQGKSRLMRILSGLLAPAVGEVFLEGEPMAAIPLQQRVRRLAILFQNPDQQIIATRVDEELSLGLVGEDAREERLVAMLEEVGLTRGELDREILSLSPSRRDRVALAALLLRRPALLFLDEPASRLSEAGEATWAKLLALRAREEELATLTFTSRPGRAALFGERILTWPTGISS